MKFNAHEKHHVAALIEKRLAQLRRQLTAEHETELDTVRAACIRDMNAMHEAMERLRAERNELLNASWSLLEERNKLLLVRKWVQWFSERDRDPKHTATEG